MIGLTEELISPIAKAAIIAAGKFARSTPGTTRSTINKLNAVATVVKKNPIIVFASIFASILVTTPPISLNQPIRGVALQRR
jgi:hypothetical protein